MTPSCGRIVHYRLSSADASVIAARRKGNPRRNGNVALAGDIVPMIIVRIWPDEYAHGATPGDYIDGEWTQFEVLGPEGVNGQAFLDGIDTHWITSASQGHGPGQWSWPPRA